MGHLFSIPTLSTSRKIRICMNGFEGAGKRSILEKFEGNADIPAGGSTYKELKKATIKNVILLTWELGGRGFNRILARRYYEKGVDIMLVVVDSVPLHNDYYIEQLSYRFKELVEEETLKDTIFLVLANKQDLDGAHSVEQVAKELDFHEVTRSHVANIMGCSAETGEGLQEAIEWLATSLEAKKERVPVKIKEEKPEEKPEKKSRSFISCVKGGFQAVKSMVKRSG